MSDRYQVKWTGKNGKVRYGIYRTEHGSHKPPKGKAIVDDAVLPVCDLVPEKDLVDIPHNFRPVQNSDGETVNDCEYDRFIAQAYSAAEKLSESLGEGLKVNKLFAVGVADGRAWYVVTRVTKTTVRVQWRGFCPDRYTDQVLGWGGSFPRRAIEPLVAREDGLRRLFGKRKVVKQP
jgi:hypothetical protein